MNINTISFDFIKKQAEKKQSNIRIILVCPDDSLLNAAELAKKNNIAQFIVIDTKKNKLRDTIIAENYEEVMRKVASLILKGEADTMAKGLINTSIFLKEIIHSKISNQLLTHTSIVELKDSKKIFIISDGTVIPNPTLEQKVTIIENSIKCANIMGIETPKIALLSANELILRGIESGYDCAILSKMAERGQINKKKIVLDGPMSLDTAVSEEAANNKKLSFAFKPPADILITPNLENGAFLIKAAVYMGGAKVAGLLWGASYPIILTSRADSEEAKYISICLCSLAKSKIQ
ncbi:MAG: hypothetical protein GX240_03510 [Candidatus Atribacteria bacterium]|nr:hypothetical protein [Candidatus Atribacteria bacterium]